MTTVSAEAPDAAGHIRNVAHREDEPMAKYMILATYTAEGLRGLKKEGPASRRQYVASVLESVGGRLEAFYWALGDHDVVAICEAPSATQVTALSMAVSASGMVRTKTVVLLTDDEVKQALAINVNYRPPGG